MAYTFILLDIDGVLETTPGWKRPEINSDGFVEFNQKAVNNLNRIISSTLADIILITSHRNKYTLSKWKSILSSRGINTNNIETIDHYINSSSTSNKRIDDVRKWITEFGTGKNYVIIDDDTSLDNLPPNLKKRWVKTSPTIGLDDKATNEALAILKSSLAA